MRSISFIALALAFITGSVYAEQSTQKATLVATVNVADTKITSTAGHVINLSFALTNRDGVQSDVRYGVRLLTTDKNQKVPTVADEHVYPEHLTLGVAARAEKTVTYTAPAQLSGTYTLLITASNMSGLPLGIAQVGTVTFDQGTKGLLIDPSSCTAKFPNGTAANIAHVLALDPGQPLTLTCLVNNTGAAVSATPTYQTTYRSPYGNTIDTADGDIKPISFAANTPKAFTISLPLAKSPQEYTLRVSLKNGAAESNAVIVQYVIRGASATAENFLLDRDRYSVGDTAVATVVWQSTVHDAPLDISGRLLDTLGIPCGEAVHTTVPAGTLKPTVQLSIPIRLLCINPKAVVTITDAKGTVLDQRNFAFTALDNGVTPRRTPLFVAAVAVALALTLAALYIKRKRILTTPQ